MMLPWPPRATDEEREMRLFKDALMRRSMSTVGALLSPEGEEELHCRTAEVEDAYARVSERAPEELKGDAAPTYAQVLTALRTKGKRREEALPPRRVLVHILARFDYYFFELACGHERVHDLPHLTDEERAAEHGLRHDLFLQLYGELEPAFDVSLNWPPSGYEVDEDGELVKVEAEFEGMEAIGYDYGYDAAIFHEGHANDEEYVRGFVEGCLERLVDQDEPEEAECLGDLWKNGGEKDKRHSLEMLKGGCEVREGRYDGWPEFPT